MPERDERPPVAPDDEHLAKLIDGKLQGAERVAVLDLLARDHGERAIFTDTVGIIHEVEQREQRVERGEGGAVP